MLAPVLAVNQSVSYGGAKAPISAELQKDPQYKPPVDSVPQARILLIGLVGAGKSSFFNSINSIFRGNITSQAEAGDMGTSLTLKVKAGRGGQPLSFLLCDTMGLEATDDGGVKTEDIVSILKGYVPDKYQVILSMSDINAMNAMHLMAYSIQHFVLNVASEFFLLMFVEVPLMVLLTKVDKACPLVEKDLKNVYRSCYIKGLLSMERCNISLYVLPVKNYSHEIELNDTCDILLLTAMQKMLNFADGYFDNWEEDTE
uniref:Uncharacterized protein n=1 Tax=Paramormyrops kingsleyae TaxID=1676925 RepID=A0A3B3Q7A7_9TELE